MSDDLLDNLLSVAANELTKECIPKNCLKDTDIFSKESGLVNEVLNKKVQSVGSVLQSSLIHNGDTDSSDDEDNKYYEERKYNESGRNIKHLLESTASTSNSFDQQHTITWKHKLNVQGVEIQKNEKNVSKKIHDMYTDPVFGLRIVNPVISSKTLEDRMVGREAITFSRIKKFIMGNISDKNWVIAGVIVGKSPVRTSQKGNPFLIWSLSDLKDDIKTVSVFLFGSAHKQLWKTSTSTVVGILNPTVLDKKDGSKDEAAISVDNAQKVMILGQSKDFGICKSVKKNGQQCTAVVNINRCEYCIYHIKQEYQKCSKRSELQSNFTGKGLNALRNKVLGKNEVFYAGKLYTAIPAKRSMKLEQKDKGRLQSLSCKSVNASGILKQKKSHKMTAANVEITHHQRLKDLTLLEKLAGTDSKSSFKASHSAEVTLESSKQMAVNVIAKLKTNVTKKTDNECSLLKVDSTGKNTTGCHSISDMQVMDIPMLKHNEKGVIDLEVPVTPHQMNKAKLNALKYVQRNGPLTKFDPNSCKKASTSRKRFEECDEDLEKNPKKQKIIEKEFLSERFKKMMNTSSKHLDLLDDRDNEEQEKYFHKLEMKEKMEEKMINTFKVPCKAVKCLQCKYTNFSASQSCKENKHPLKVFDATKRFFKCSNCGNRTQSLDIIPTSSCKNCGSEKWGRTGMMKEKKAEVTHSLSIRGGEQKFINSVISNTNLDLLMPDE